MPYEKSNKEIQESKVKGFKMKGSPMKRNFGIGADSPMKQDDTIQTYSGVKFDPMSSYDYKDSPNIPSFRDIVSLEQQQAYADKVDKRRAERKEGEKKDESVGLDKVNKEDFVALSDQSLDAGVDLTEQPDKFDPLAKDKIKYGKPNNVMDLKINS